MSNQFSSGLEVANVLVTSDPLRWSWDAIQEQRVYRQHNPKPETFLYIKETQQSNRTIITFLTGNMSLKGKEGLVSSSTLKNDSFDKFEFLRNKNISSFSVNKAAIDIFKSHFDDLDALRTKISKSKSLVIITGHSMGGCVATLFTLWLLENLDLKKSKRPFCVTFGSPFLGDENLRKCVSQFSTWNSCFLNVASIQDSVPKVFLSPNPTAPGTSLYKPFGTFLLVSDLGCACFEDPDSVSVLVGNNSHSAQTQDPDVGIQFFDYGQILKRLKSKAYCKDVFELAAGRDRVPLRATIITQLEAIYGVQYSQALQQQQPNINIEHLIKKMETHEHKLAIQKTRASNASKKLNDSKMSMALMEWYKKDAKRMEIGYYDMYKNKRYMSDINVEEYKKKLSNYWEDLVTEAENKPQREGAAFRTGWLRGGTTYRRMMEPLHIAEYYKDTGGKDYITEKRPGHFKMLEKWLNEEEDRIKAEKIKKGEKIEAGPSKSKAENVATSLTDDSCFWAHVEEALISCNVLKNAESSIQDQDSCKEKLKVFEKYVLDALKNFAVSPEIFLKHSSFMKWWEEYKKIVGRSYSSPLVDIMKDRSTYGEYEAGQQVVF